VRSAPTGEQVLADPVFFVDEDYKAIRELRFHQEIARFDLAVNGN
jgi:hypothetical protein